MPDRKFNRDDRQLVLTDLKNRILDMQANPFVAPDVPWDAEPVRYFKLNLQWCKILAGWLEWMEDVAGWQDAEDDLHAGIQGFLAFERGIEGEIPMDAAEFKQALYEGLYKWTNDVAKQIVSGVTSGFAVDDDGNVVPPGEDVDLPDDDPETPADENAESRNGSAIAYANGINGFLGRISSLFGVDTTEDRTVAEAIEIMENLYMHGETVTAFSTAMGEYWTRRAAGQDVVVSVNDLAEAIYCEGFSLATVIELIYTQESDVDAADLAADLLSSAIDSDLTNFWIMKGSAIPSTDYIEYGCTPVPTETFQLNLDGTGDTKTGVIAQKEDHRLLINIAGKATDAAFPGVEIDFFYRKNADGSIVRQAGIGFFTGAGFNSGNQPADAKIPYQASGIYRFTMDTLDDGFLTFTRDNGTLGVGTVGLIDITVEDLGSIEV